ncbi:hypothetical protein HPB51_014852 [Rhipicephalus microplus]|uniref:Secreted protein n=1 Tax=Rhipicephalus microplus TaxID=6941 RepID=A0A9J6DNM3_RHIMP|nr:hypothetical protein HPB51_014852 [Rhipicephalus microplus]
MPFGAVLVSAALVALQADIVPRNLKRMVDAPCLASSLVIDHHQWKLLLVPALHSFGTSAPGLHGLNLGRPRLLPRTPDGDPPIPEHTIDPHGPHERSFLRGDVLRPAELQGSRWCACL